MKETDQQRRERLAKNEAIAEALYNEVCARRSNTSMMWSSSTGRVDMKLTEFAELLLGKEAAAALVAKATGENHG